MRQANKTSKQEEGTHRSIRVTRVALSGLIGLSFIQYLIAPKSRLALFELTEILTYNW